ncbi:MAG: M28 family peptidase [Chloroflexota bacterium]|nr:M28 family peptidase [Chloroflexota bacterium]
MESVEAKAMRHLEHLCVEIGPRPVGSKENQAAADYIQRVFEANGLEVEVQEFPCPLWKDKETRLELGGERLIAAANAFSPPCDVTAPPVAVGTVAELEAAILSGRIGVLYGDLTKGTGLGARSAVYYPERDQKIVGLLEEKQPAALITVHSKIGSLERLIRDWEFPIPSATVPAEVGLTLLRHGGPTLRLRIDSHQSPGHFCNVVATRAGDGRRRVALLAHFDTVHESPGAIDNGSGVATLLALAESLAERDLPVGVEWIAVNGEESGGLGDAEYLRRREGDLEQILALINVDGVGQQVGANTITMLGASQSFQDQVRKMHERYPSVVWVDPWYESDHSAFYWRGVPCVPFSSVGVANVGHLPTDTIEWIGPAKLSEVVMLTADIVESLLDKSPDWYRESKSQ